MLLRIKIAFHALRGKPVIANNTFRGGITIHESQTGGYIANNRMEAK